MDRPDYGNTSGARDLHLTTEEPIFLGSDGNLPRAIAITRACARAFPLPEHFAHRIKSDGRRETANEWHTRLTPEVKAEIRTWKREHWWHPYQLRHNAATNLRKEFGVEVAWIILGHATAFTTEIYAEADRFLLFLPRIDAHAKVYFRDIRCDAKRADRIAETIA